MNQNPLTEDPIITAIRKQAALRQRGRQQTFWAGLRLVGAIGWMVSLPSVFGAWCGHWLDANYQSGVFWTLSFLAAGLFLGCAAAWRHVWREMK